MRLLKLLLMICIKLLIRVILLLKEKKTFMIRLMRIFLWKKGITKSAPVLFRKLDDYLKSIGREDLPLSLSNLGK